MEFSFLPFFFLGLGGPPGTWGGAATRGGDAMRGLNIRSIHSSRCCLHLAASSDWRTAIARYRVAAELLPAALSCAWAGRRETRRARSRRVHETAVNAITKNT